MLNPTSCAELRLNSAFASYEAGEHSSAAPYRATGCESLPFSPKLRFQVQGDTKADGHPSLKATVTQPPGQANIARSRVLLPAAIRPELLALQRPGVLCPEALAATRSCPPTSRVGTARVVTPVLPEPLSGPVYIVQHAASPLPKLVIHLDGLVSIRLEAQNQIQRVQIVNTFGAVPDVPITSFELRISGGKNGILKNFTSLCAKELRGEVAFDAHSGKSFSDKPVVDVPGCESASAAPRASIALRGVRGGEPVLTVRVRRASGGAKLNGLRISLPSALRANRGMAGKGVRVESTRRLARGHWKLTRRALVVEEAAEGRCGVDPRGGGQGRPEADSVAARQRRARGS